SLDLHGTSDGGAREIGKPARQSPDKATDGTGSAPVALGSHSSPSTSGSMLKKISLASPTFWATTHSAFEQAFWIALFALQAPLLGPHAFGLVALAMVLVGFCEFVFVTVASEALVSLNEIEDRHFDTMLTVTILASLVAAAAIFFGA